MATYSNTLTWRILWTEEPDGLQCMGSQRVGLNLGTEQQQMLGAEGRVVTNTDSVPIPRGVYSPLGPLLRLVHSTALLMKQSH